MYRRDIPSVQNTEFLLDNRLYEFTLEINRLEYDPTYPKDPQSVGQLLRKTRMDRELRDIKPALKHLRRKLVEFLGVEVSDGRIPTQWPLQLREDDSKSFPTQAGS